MHDIIVHNPIIGKVINCAGYSLIYKQATILRDTFQQLFNSDATGFEISYDYGDGVFCLKTDKHESERKKFIETLDKISAISWTLSKEDSVPEIIDSSVLQDLFQVLFEPSKKALVENDTELIFYSVSDENIMALKRLTDKLEKLYGTVMIRRQLMNTVPNVTEHKGYAYETNEK